MAGVPVDAVYQENGFPLVHVWAHEHKKSDKNSKSLKKKPKQRKVEKTTTSFELQICILHEQVEKAIMFLF